MLFGLPKFNKICKVSNIQEEIDNVSNLNITQKSGEVQKS